MKEPLLFIPLLFLQISISCSYPQNTGKESYDTVYIKDTVLQDKVADINSYDEQTYNKSINFLEFTRYQTFDEFKMKGVGKPVYEPFVYVKTEKKKVVVIVSDDTTNVMTYHLRDDGLWYMHIDFDLWKKDQNIVKSSKENLARSYDRICGNDTIVELRWYYMNNYTSKCFWLKTSKDCIRSQSLHKDYFSNKDEIYASLRKFTNEFLKEENGLKNNTNKPLRYKRYSLYENIDGYWYFGEKDSLFFKKNSLGFFGIQPGFDKYDRELSSRDYFP